MIWKILNLRTYEIQYIILKYQDITPEIAENWFLSPVNLSSERFSCPLTSFVLLFLSFVSFGEDGEKHGQQNGGIFERPFNTIEFEKLHSIVSVFANLRTQQLTNYHISIQHDWILFDLLLNISKLSKFSFAYKLFVML